MDVNKLPSFKDVAMSKYESFIKNMKEYNILVDISYEDWCDLWINSGMLEDIDECIMLPNEIHRSIEATDVVIMPKEDAASLLAALQSKAWYSDQFTVYEGEVDFCDTTDSADSWVDTYEGETDDD